MISMKDWWHFAKIGETSANRMTAQVAAKGVVNLRLRDFGLTSDDLRELADAFYFDEDPRRISLDPLEISLAARIRSGLRSMADYHDAQVSKAQRELEEQP